MKVKDYVRILGSEELPVIKFKGTTGVIEKINVFGQEGFHRVRRQVDGEMCIYHESQLKVEEE